MTTVQRDEAWLSAATPAQVAQAHAAGELVGLLGGTPSTVPDEGQLTAEHISGMPPAEVAAAFGAGRLNEHLGRPVPGPSSTPAPPAAPAVNPPSGPVYVPPPWLPALVVDEPPADLPSAPEVVT